jgi:hypothetical protein
MCRQVLVNGACRSIVYYPGAGTSFDEDMLRAAPVVRALRAAAVMYITGFFVTASRSAAVAAARMREAPQRLCFNLSAPFVMEVYEAGPRRPRSALPYHTVATMFVYRGAAEAA